jgi:ABC-type Fe3+ transport system substrate-binding protein
MIKQRARSRRSLAVLTTVAAMVTVAACGGASSGTSSQPAESKSKKLELLLGVPLGEVYPLVVEDFRKAHPDVDVKATSIHTANFTARLQEERRNGVHAWDAFIGGPDVDLYRLADEALDPVKPEITDKTLLDDSTWMWGFDANFSDTKKQKTYNFGIQAFGGAFWINRDFISKADVATTDDLWKPELRGKIAWHDPRQSGSGVNSAAVLLDQYGADKLESLWKDQKVTVSADQRQLIEWAVRGRYPMVAGLLDRELRAVFQEQGLGKNIVNLPVPNFVSAIPGSDSVALVKDAPNPEARRIFLNWLLSKEGQQSYVTHGKGNSRRTDVTPGNPPAMPPAGLDAPPLNTQSEAFAPTRVETNELARKVFGG